MVALSLGSFQRNIPPWCPVLVCQGSGAPAVSWESLGMVPIRPKDFGYRPINHILDHWWELGLCNSDILVFAMLWRKRNHDTNITAKVSQQWLSERTRLHRSTVNRSLKRLETVGYIERTRGGGGWTTTYLVKCPAEETHYVASERLLEV